MGDLSTKTGIDFLVSSKYDNCQPDDELEMLTLSCLNIQEKRVSVDKVVNTYGNRLLELCKSANMYIVNGQFDNDALQGKATCDNVSVVDYVICSPFIFSYIDSFIVQYHDPMLSDIHCAVNTNCIVHEPGPPKGGHWYHKKVQIIVVIFDKVYVCTTYFCMIAVCM